MPARQRPRLRQRRTGLTLAGPGPHLGKGPDADGRARRQLGDPAPGGRQDRDGLLHPAGPPRPARVRHAVSGHPCAEPCPDAAPGPGRVRGGFSRCRRR
ncbi:hypothetical protein SCOCK_80033 [Actinacidiphila cocklensis]|uniref:Uncharacterized protein n=1 Tax=Actinacidiphila cocklensis TaxID=887465 RepID=A0A9W4GWD6_9ACTN|nr:hypothetical protein SCOCK_80033 [Actinacidiphila cocklensis]